MKPKNDFKVPDEYFNFLEQSILMQTTNKPVNLIRLNKKNNFIWLFVAASAVFILTFLAINIDFRTDKSVAHEKLYDVFLDQKQPLDIDLESNVYAEYVALND